MLFSPPNFRSDAPPNVPAIVQTVLAQAVTWNRPVFKAPPLDNVQPPIADVEDFAAELPKLGRAER